VKEITLSTNSGQTSVLSNHAPIVIAIDISNLRIHLNDQWLMMALKGGFARISNNEVIVLVNDVEKGVTLIHNKLRKLLKYHNQIISNTMKKI